MRASTKRTEPRRSTRRRASRSSAHKLRRVRIDDGPFAVVTQGDLLVVFWGTVPLYSLRANDRLGRYAAAVDLVRLHHLRPEAVGESLGISRRTMYRLLERFKKGGVAALLGSKGFRQPTKILGASAVQLLELKRQGASNREAARRLVVSPSGVAAALRRLELKQQQGPQPCSAEGTAGEPEREPRVSSDERSAVDVTAGSATSKDEVSSH
jgi:transposase